MNADRMGGPPPIDPGRNSNPDTKAAREERQKVEKVREIDPDEETNRRKRKFQMMMGDEDTLAEGIAKPRQPSPFETQFHLNDKVNDAVVPSPAYSPPPDVTASLPAEDDGETDLPQSQDFWSDVDFPPDEPPSPQNYEETPQSQSRPLSQTDTRSIEEDRAKTRRKQEISAAKQKEQKTRNLIAQGEKKEPSPFGAPGKPADKTDKKSEKAPFFAGVPEEKGATPSSKAPHQKTPPSAPSQTKGGFFLPESEKAKASMKSGAPHKKEEKSPTGSQPVPKIAPPSSEKGKIEKKQDLFDETPTARSLTREETEERKERHSAKGTAPHQTFKSDKNEPKPPPSILGQKDDDSAAPYQPQEGGDREQGRKKGGPVVEIEATSMPHVPASVQPAAQAAATQATPYLSPETIPLFYQMVGTIYVMTTPPGVSRTEIVLDSPNFANSKFYGSTITIEKYASAPDSLNIRLSGSNTAVATFKENIPNLLMAFQNGNFKFKVNRIEAEYATGRPVFRRKEKGEGKDFGGDFEDRRR